ncbi:MAG TPA: DUF2269 family protein [Azospirillaceae bacterium]|nr:DUF2269 family protein [Azospirillaceae bacterium]
MRAMLRLLHLIGLAAFLGSILVHILLGEVVDPAHDLAGYALAMKIKYLATLILTLPGLALMILTGTVMAWRQRLTLLTAKWLGAKLVLVILIALNGAAVLTPLGAETARLAAEGVLSGALPATFTEVKQKEDIAGALNLLMIVAVSTLALVRPGTRIAVGRA